MYVQSVEIAFVKIVLIYILADVRNVKMDELHEAGTISGG